MTTNNPTPASTRARIAGLREMLAQATPGPWRRTPYDHRKEYWIESERDSVARLWQYRDERQREANARILADARAVLERALAAAEEAMALYDKQVEFNKTATHGEGYRGRCEAEDSFLSRANAALDIALREGK